MEKLQLKKVHPTGRGQHVRLDNALIKEVAVLSGETGYSMKKLMDKLVRFALDNVEVVDDEESEETGEKDTMSLNEFLEENLPAERPQRHRGEVD